MQVDPDWLVRLLEKGISPALIVLAFVTGWIVPRYVYLDLLRRIARMEAIIERYTELSDRALGSAERIADRTKQQP